MALSTASNEAIWLRNLMIETLLYAEQPIQVYCDNESAITLSENAKFSPSTKHLMAKSVAIKELIDKKQLKVNFKNTKDMTADMLQREMI